jgi:hypothetical protein
MLTGMYLAAALIAIGDDLGAMELMAGIRIITSEENRETVSNLAFFIDTALNPQAAWEHVQSESANLYVSDIPERINFIRRTVMTGGAESEFSYNLHGETHTVSLAGFERHFMHISHEQFEALDLTPISGDTGFHFSFYGYDDANWNPDHMGIAVSRSMSPENNLIRIDIDIDLLPGVHGFFTVHDRLPSNLRFVPHNIQQTGPERFFVRHVQRQLVEISFFVPPQRSDGLTSRRVTYHAMELFEADMSEGATFVTNSIAERHLWGRTR